MGSVSDDGLGSARPDGSSDPTTLWGLLYRLCADRGCTVGALILGCPAAGVLLEVSDPSQMIFGVPAGPGGIAAGLGMLISSWVIKRVQQWRQRHK